MSQQNQGQRQLVARALSLADISKIAGVSRPTVSRWKKGERAPQDEPRRRIEIALGIPYADWDVALGPGDIIPDDVHIRSGPKVKNKPRTYRQPGTPQMSPNGPAYRQATVSPTGNAEGVQGPSGYVQAPPEIPPYPEAPVNASTLGMVRHSLACLQHDMLHRSHTAAARSKARADETRTLALIAKLEAVEELKEDRYVRDHPEWKRLRDCILGALEGHPEAARDVIGAMELEYEL